MRTSGERITEARLAANMSRADLAFAIRRISKGSIKATERGLRGWEKGEYRPSDGVVPTIAEATGKAIEFFYEAGGNDDDEEEAALPDAMAALEQALMRVVRRAVRDQVRV